MSKLSEAEQQLLNKYVQYIEANIPGRSLLSNSSIGNIKDQIHSIIGHDISGFFAWRAGLKGEITAMMTILTNGNVIFNWGSTEQELKSAKEAIQLYGDIVSFGEKLQSQLKVDLEKIKP